MKKTFKSWNKCIHTLANNAARSIIASWVPFTNISCETWTRSCFTLHLVVQITKSMRVSGNFRFTCNHQPISKPIQPVTYLSSITASSSSMFLSAGEGAFTNARGLLRVSPALQASGGKGISSTSCRTFSHQVLWGNFLLSWTRNEFQSLSCSTSAFSITSIAFKASGTWFDQGACSSSILLPWFQMGNTPSNIGMNILVSCWSFFFCFVPFQRLSLQYFLTLCTLQSQDIVLWVRHVVP